MQGQPSIKFSRYFAFTESNQQLFYKKLFHDEQGILELEPVIQWKVFRNTIIVLTENNKVYNIHFDEDISDPIDCTDQILDAFGSDCHIEKFYMNNLSIAYQSGNKIVTCDFSDGQCKNSIEFNDDIIDVYPFFDDLLIVTFSGIYHVNDQEKRFIMSIDQNLIVKYSRSDCRIFMLFNDGTVFTYDIEEKHLNRIDFGSNVRIIKMINDVNVLFVSNNNSIYKYENKQVIKLSLSDNMKIQNVFARDGYIIIVHKDNHINIVSKRTLKNVNEYKDFVIGSSDRKIIDIKLNPEPYCDKPSRYFYVMDDMSIYCSKNLGHYINTFGGFPVEKRFFYKI